VIGGIVWGVRSALHEAAHIDARCGKSVNCDLAEYALPVHADIVGIDTDLLPDLDDQANPVGMKGVGESGVCGSDAGVASAMFNHTDIRVREVPITLDKLLRS
jgi:xanthine dehydrogenase YagR molybdenum-binding subunit